MSIPNIFDKIKSKSGIDRNTVMFLFIIVGVGIASFGLGRISSSYDRVQDTVDQVPSKELIVEDSILSTNLETLDTTQTKEKRYVASKNGKMYYTIGCSGASRIKPENRIWFSTSEDAIKSGFTMSSTCK